ncbi:MAG TPA: sialidase [Clostridiales bacterium]|jgi:Neuraminidase (sialidase)|nr:sialidase [Clostridiales bacterium]
MNLFYFIILGILISFSLPARSQISGNVTSPKLVLHLPPGDNNLRNSEGDFITLKDGRILFVYSHFSGSSVSDHTSAHLAGRFSDDGGKTWSKEDITVIENEGNMNIMSVSLLRLKNGNIALFYLRKNSMEDCIPMMRISTDEAITWSNPIKCITDKKGYFVLNNDRVIQLKNGRILMAVALHKTTNETSWRDKAKIYSYYSDDNGLTWHCSEEVSNPLGVVTQEPGVIELKNGTILMIIRASGGFQQLSFSKDKGKTWSPMVTSNIHSPLSPASIARIKSTGDLLLAWNNNGSNQSRTPLTLAVSKDEGQTWELVTDIETDPDGSYCYVAIHFTKNDVLLSYLVQSVTQNPTFCSTKVVLLRQKDIYKKNKNTL